MSSLPFPVLVLAAGRGVRLDPLTRIVAKPAVPLGTRTLIEHVLERLAQQKLTDIIVNLHHLPHTIAAVVGDGSQFGVRLRYSWEQPVVLGSAGGPRHALPLLGAEQFLIVNSDTLCDVDVAALFDQHRRTRAEVTLAVIPNPAPERYGGVVVDDDGAVTGFTRKGDPRPSWHFVGVQAANASVFAPLEDGVPVNSVGGLYDEAIALRPGRIRAWPTKATFVDVGTPHDYLEAAIAMGTTTTDQSIVWPGASVAPDATLRRCIVAAGVRVPPGFKAQNSILLPAALRREDDSSMVRDGIAMFALSPTPRTSD